MSYPYKIHGRIPKKKLVIFTLNNSYIYTSQHFFITVLPLLRSFFFPNGPSIIFIMVLLFFVCISGNIHAGGCIVLVAMFLWSQGLKDHNLVLNYTYKSIWPWIALFPESTSPVKVSQTLLLKYSIKMGKNENITPYLHLFLPEVIYSHLCQMMGSVLYRQKKMET